MASGFLQRFQGKIKCAQLWLGSGSTSGVYDNASGVRVALAGAARLSLAVTATANTDFTLSLPVGASVKSFVVYTTTAYGAVTDAKISIGTSAGDQTYVAQTSIKAAGIVSLTIATSAAVAAAMLVLPAAPQLFIRVVQTGTASATGAATLIVAYDLA